MVIRAAGKVALACILTLALWTGSAQALSLQQIGNFDEPIYVTSDPGNPERLFVVERSGIVVQVENGSAQTFADLRLQVDCCGGEQGLLSIALSPDFDQSGRFFVDYTGEEEPGEIHVAEMRATGSTALASTPRNLLTIPHPEDDNHYGGQLQFGPEGDLFISTGDGGGGNDEHHNSQNLETLLGKVLRIDPDQAGVLPLHLSRRKPLRRQNRPRRDLGLRPAQSLPLLLRSADRGADDRRRRPGRPRGGRLRLRSRPRGRRQLRLELPRGVHQRTGDRRTLLQNHPARRLRRTNLRLSARRP